MVSPQNVTNETAPTPDNGDGTRTWEVNLTKQRG
jgi:hypothetical protein